MNLKHQKKHLKHLQETTIEHTAVNTTETSTSKSKNENTASVLNRGQQENINLFTVINL